MEKKQKTYSLLQLTSQFILKSKTGRRLQPNGKRISAATIRNYSYLYKHLEAFEQIRLNSGYEPLRVKSIRQSNAKTMNVEKNYWNRFYFAFTDYLYRQGCYDNYVGTIIKQLRSVFRYAELELMIPVGPFYKSFHVPKDEVSITTLNPERLAILINHDEISKRLTKELLDVKDIIVFGCTVALRFGDLFTIRKTDIRLVGDKKYLEVRSQKTNTVTRVLLPKYALDIVDRQLKKERPTVFEPICLNWFNLSMRRVFEQLGWTEEIGKERSQRGRHKHIMHPVRNKPYRFCDAASSHLMRRTAITTMLMNGVPEMVVKKISGHSGNSKAFYRYVNLVQVYLDNSVESHFEKMMSIGS